MASSGKMDIFADSKTRFSHAKEYIIILKREIKTFLDDYAQKTYVIEPDPSYGGQYLHKIKITQTPPKEIVVLTTNIIDNLRATLDLAWGALAIASGAVDPDAEDRFPFAANAIKFNSNLSRRLKNFSQDILAIPRRFKPYKDGDDLLWALNRICATNKHPLLATTFVRLRKIEGEITKWGVGRVPSPMRWNDRKKEIVFFVTEYQTLTDAKIKVTLDVAFNKTIHIVGGKPIITTLNAFVDKVEEVLLALEDVALRLGLIA